MFDYPDIDTSKSSKIIIHLAKVKNEYVPVMELSFLADQELNVEVLLEMRKALDHCSLKIDKIINNL